MKILTKETCPGCKKEFDSQHDLENLEPKIIKGEIKTIEGSTNQVLETPKPEIKIETKTVIEDFKPGYECPDGNCEIKVHPNKNYSKRVKGKCSNCDQFTKNEKGKCPWCKKDEIEEIDTETLEELGIEMPLIDEHEGHNHE